MREQSLASVNGVQVTDVCAEFRWVGNENVKFRDEQRGAERRVSGQRQELTKRQ